MRVEFGFAAGWHTQAEEKLGFCLFERDGESPGTKFSDQALGSTPEDAAVKPRVQYFREYGRRRSLRMGGSRRDATIDFSIVWLAGGECRSARTATVVSCTAAEAARGRLVGVVSGPLQSATSTVVGVVSSMRRGSLGTASG